MNDSTGHRKQGNVQGKHPITTSASVYSSQVQNPSLLQPKTAEGMQTGSRTDQSLYQTRNPCDGNPDVPTNNGLAQSTDSFSVNFLDDEQARSSTSHRPQELKEAWVETAMNVSEAGENKGVIFLNTHKLFKAIDDLQVLCNSSKGEIGKWQQATGMHYLLDIGTSEAVRKYESLVNELEHLKTENAEAEQQHMRAIANLQQCYNNSIQSLKASKQSSEEKLKAENKMLKSELSTCKTRLSQIMGAKLSDNNPDIADLSDQNRPTKLAERYQNMYDNEWTDAYEIAFEFYKDEKKSIQLLKRVLKDIRSHCDDMCREQTASLLAALEVKPDVKLSIDATKPIKDLKKATAELYLTKVYEQYLSHLNEICNKEMKELFSHDKMEYFVRSCVEVCWLMSVQDPPVTLHPDPTLQTPFDANKYKYYTQTGSHLEFVVWPPLLLHEDGPVLTKGIAQAVLQPGHTVQKGSIRRKGKIPLASDSEQTTHSPPLTQSIDRFGEDTQPYGEQSHYNPSETNKELYYQGQTICGTANTNRSKGSKKNKNA